LRFYFRTRTGGVSVGVIGAVLLGIAVATVWFYVALVVVPILVLAGIGYIARGMWQWARRR
jgi:hypothetical protein